LHKGIRCPFKQPTDDKDKNHNANPPRENGEPEPALFMPNSFKEFTSIF